jgi:ribonucleotide reductase alpha subunit
LRLDPTGAAIEDATGMVRRVANAVAAPSSRYGESAAQRSLRFLAWMEQIEFLPNSAALIITGVPAGQLASANSAYDSDQAVAIAARIAAFMTERARAVSLVEDDRIPDCRDCAV